MAKQIRSFPYVNTSGMDCLMTSARVIDVGH